ncbi:MAG: queuosine precursor transporter [Candidatus Magasanikbacteria bacterium]|nr:queuosine precursor transporter [Candidatus Magasanikbacteria bacterium]
MQTTKYYHVIIALFSVCLVVSNIIAVKIGSFLGYFLPVAVILFPFTYILGDVLTEVYGYAAARRAIWTGFFCNLVAVIAIWLSIKIVPAPFFANQPAFAAILGFTPRLLVASFLAYLVGQFANSYILSKLKIRTQGKHLWARTVGSTVVGEGLDSLVFIVLAFSGVLPSVAIPTLVLTQWIFKSAFEVVATPFTYIVVNYLKQAEGLDVYDHQTNFNPVKIN